MNINFTRSDKNIVVDSGGIQSLLKNTIVPEIKVTSQTLLVTSGYLKMYIYANDTVTINNTLFSGTLSELAVALSEEVFFLPVSGPGGEVTADAVQETFADIDNSSIPFLKVAELVYIPKVFNIVQFGADPTFVADSTVAIQSAINSAFAAGGGQVFFPNGRYKIAGPLITSDNNGLNPNSQLYIPSLNTNVSDLTSFGTRCHIELTGQEKPNFTANGYFADFLPSLTGVVLQSTLVTASGTAPAIIGGIDTNTVFGTFNYNYLTVKNISFFVPYTNANGPIIGGINASNIAVLQADNILVTSYRSFSTNFNAPTNEVAGITTAKNAGDGNNYLKNVVVAHFKYGVVLGEHAVVDQLNVTSCVYALVFAFATHPALITRIQITQCNNLFFFPATSILGLTQVGITTADVTQVAVELRKGEGSWLEFENAIVDTANYGRGIIRYKLFNAVNQTDADNLFTKLGGLYITGRPIWGGLYPGVRQVTAASVTLDDAQTIIKADSTSNSITLNLPSAATCVGREYKVKKMSANNTVTIDAFGVNSIDGQGTMALTTIGASVSIISDGDNWYTFD